jgi:hypothetical protein
MPILPQEFIYECHPALFAYMLGISSENKIEDGDTKFNHENAIQMFLMIIP